MARALSLTYMVAGVVARSLPSSLNRTTRHLEGLRKTAAADRAELKRLQAGLRGLNKDTDAYRMAVARVEKSKLGLAEKGREIRDVTGRQRDLQQGASRLRGGLVRAGLVIGTVTGLAASLGVVLSRVSGRMRDLRHEALATGTATDALFDSEAFGRFVGSVIGASFDRKRRPRTLGRAGRTHWAGNIGPRFLALRPGRLRPASTART